MKLGQGCPFLMLKRHDVASDHLQLARVPIFLLLSAARGPPLRARDPRARRRLLWRREGGQLAAEAFELCEDWALELGDLTFDDVDDVRSDRLLPAGRHTLALQAIGTVAALELLDLSPEAFQVGPRTDAGPELCDFTSKSIEVVLRTVVRLEFGELTPDTVEVVVRTSPLREVLEVPPHTFEVAEPAALTSQRGDVLLERRNLGQRVSLRLKLRNTTLDDLDLVSRCLFLLP
mmetsp:Transcript_63975/g.166250  ORF Transcript_63975/g.166250 Transcript_63975/m.166250 type:complete len:233 (-) Transcript_63975:639-1337(-)